VVEPTAEEALAEEYAVEPDEDEPQAHDEEAPAEEPKDDAKPSDEKVDDAPAAEAAELKQRGLDVGLTEKQLEALGDDADGLILRLEARDAANLVQPVKPSEEPKPGEQDEQPKDIQDIFQAKIEAMEDEGVHPAIVESVKSVMELVSKALKGAPAEQPKGGGQDGPTTEEIDAIFDGFDPAWESKFGKGGLVGISDEAHKGNRVALFTTARHLQSAHNQGVAKGVIRGKVWTLKDAFDRALIHNHLDDYQKVVEGKVLDKLDKSSKPVTHRPSSTRPRDTRNPEERAIAHSKAFDKEHEDEF